MSNAELPAARKEPFRFRLIHVFYAMAVLGASLATCGVGGIFLAVWILVMWYAVFWGEPASPAPESGTKPSPRAFTLVELLVVTAIIAVLIAFLLPAVRSARGAASRSHCSSNLTQIALALHNYHHTYGAFPPAYVADESGKPMHSWRVLILPFLASGPLYDKYRFDEPWDGPNNRQLLKHMPHPYHCPAHPLAGGETTTCYFAVVGPQTAWPGAASRKLDDSPHVSSTLLVLEGPAHKIAWSEPRDLSLEEAVALLREPSQASGAHVYDQSFLYTTLGGRNSAVADGSTRWLPPVVTPAIARRLLSITEVATPEELDELPSSYPRYIKWANLMRLAILICLALLPLPWAIAKMRKHATITDAPQTSVRELR